MNSPLHMRLEGSLRLPQEATYLLIDSIAFWDPWCRLRQTKIFSNIWYLHLYIFSSSDQFYRFFIYMALDYKSLLLDCLLSQMNLFNIL
jgi:hypothetical protein